MNDPTEQIRRDMIRTGQPQADLRAEHLGTCEFCKAGPRALIAVLEADPDQRVCGECHSDPRLPTVQTAWDTEGLTRDFEVLGFMAPFVVVKRRSDDKEGSLEFAHHPRVYFGWKEA